MTDWNQDDKRRIEHDELAYRQWLQNHKDSQRRKANAISSRTNTPKEKTEADKKEWFEEVTHQVYSDGWRLLLKKHEDYGPKNIAQAPGGALNGLRVRMWDKMARINHLLDNGADAKNESLRDSFVDLMNYAAIAQLVLDNDWPTE